MQHVGHNGNDMDSWTHWPYPLSFKKFILARFALDLLTPTLGRNQR